MNRRSANFVNVFGLMCGLMLASGLLPVNVAFAGCIPTTCPNCTVVILTLASAEHQ